MSTPVSVIIRTYNEQKWLPAVLKALEGQTIGYELVIVDSGSTDQTLSIAKQAKARIVALAHDRFTYPHASNVGASEARGQYLCYLSGHSVPIGKDFLSAGVADFNRKERICGVYGPVRPLPDASLVERIWYTTGALAKRGVQIESRPHMGMLGHTNALVPRVLWQQHPYDERYVEGGEDLQWARFWLQKGYRVVFEPRFAVRHSHSLSLGAFIGQWRHWKRVSTSYPD